MKLTSTISLISALAFLTASALVAEPPQFYSKTSPEHALRAMLEADKTLMGPEAKLNAKTRELIALGVSAQIPCPYCVYVHDKKARAQGATESEIREAVAAAAHVRHWSTVLNGMAYDLDDFKIEVDNLLASN
mgnify:CR=1 FL=1